jgi:hypothetical protein
MVTNIESDLSIAMGFGVPINEVEFISRPSKERKREQGKATTLQDLIQVGQRRNMKNPVGWARHVLAARQTKGQWADHG